VTLQYLQQLQAFRKFWRTVVRPGDDERLPEVEVKPDIPQFHAGTGLALVRQLLLIDDAGQIVPSDITEEAQFRIYRDIDGSDSPDRNATKRFQEFFEFRLKREKLFGGMSGGLHAITDSEAEFPIFASHGTDMLDKNESPSTPNSRFMRELSFSSGYSVRPQPEEQESRLSADGLPRSQESAFQP
jgi:hypothetical protein